MPIESTDCLMIYAKYLIKDTNIAIWHSLLHSPILQPSELAILTVDILMHCQQERGNCRWHLYRDHVANRCICGSLEGVSSTTTGEDIDVGLMGFEPLFEWSDSLDCKANSDIRHYWLPRSLNIIEANFASIHV